MKGSDLSDSLGQQDDVVLERRQGHRLMEENKNPPSKYIQNGAKGFFSQSHSQFNERVILII